MSSKGIMFVTNSCGYCKMAKQQVEKEFPDLDPSKFYYVNLDEGPNEEEKSIVSELVKNSLIRGVPFTLNVLTKSDKSREILDIVRGYNMEGIRNIIKNVTKIETNQLEITFKEEEE